MCRGQGKGWRCERAGAPASERPTQKNDSQGGGWRTQEWCHGNALNEHVLVEPSTVSYNPMSRQPGPETCAPAT